ncbi:cupredoxin domain-containing protein [Candidatus Acetothermia bacterium]|nr:cupredoxin domain-containing protein [Candidatus Acetothermia bacterium]
MKLFSLKRWLLVAAVAILVIGLGGLDNSAQTNSVSIQNFSFKPPVLTVPVGTTVTWTNLDGATHTTTSRSNVWDSGNLNTNQKFSFTFTKAGEFDYFCTIHPFMEGKVIVTAGQGQAEKVQEVSLIHSLKDLKIYPNQVTVEKGTKVRVFNTATDGAHPSVIISKDEAGQQPVFNVTAYDVEVGKLTVIEFTPDTAGEFFITHKLHGHNIVAKLIVKG